MSTHCYQTIAVSLCIYIRPLHDFLFSDLATELPDELSTISWNGRWMDGIAVITVCMIIYTLFETYRRACSHDMSQLEFQHQTLPTIFLLKSELCDHCEKARTLLGAVHPLTVLLLSARPSHEVHSRIGRRGGQVSSNQRSETANATHSTVTPAWRSCRRRAVREERGSKGHRNTTCLLIGVERSQMSSKAFSLVLMHNLSLQINPIPDHRLGLLNRSCAYAMHKSS